jgi:hypothetical protein
MVINPPFGSADLLISFRSPDTVAVCQFNLHIFTLGLLSVCVRTDHSDLENGNRIVGVANTGQLIVLLMFAYKRKKDLMERSDESGRQYRVISWQGKN